MRRFRLDAILVVLVSALALGPTLVQRGYLLVGDMTFVPDQPWKPAWLGLDGSVPRAVPADALVSVVGAVVPGDLLQKGILLGTLVLAGLGLARLAGRVPGLPWQARLGGAVLYMWNPYVFERLAIGHWGLLVGYAALPWVLDAGLVLRDSGGARAAARLLLLLAVPAAGSPTGGLVAVLVAIVVVPRRDRLRGTAVVVGASIVVNLPWLAPAVLNGVGTSDRAGVAAFAAQSDSPLGTWPSLLTFGGIWKASVVPGDRDATLLVAAALLLVLASLVAVAVVARRDPHAITTPGRLLLLAALGLLLAGVPATGPGERWVTDLVDAVPGLGIWRDSQKWLMPFVLVTSLGFALLLRAVGSGLQRLELPVRAPTTAFAALPMLLLPSLGLGLSGRLQPVSYPTEWAHARSALAAQPAADRRTAVLPWSAYQRLPWNDGRAALDPALRYFPGQMVASEDLALGGGVTVRGDRGGSAAIGRAIDEHQPLGPVLAAAGVRYLLVERTAPTAAEPVLPAGTVLHDSHELLLLDLGGPGRPQRAPHRVAILVADGIAAVAVLGAAGVLLIRRRRTAGIRYHHRGSGEHGGHADDR